MYRFMLIGLIGLGSLVAQSGLDILNSPNDARSAALGINLSPTLKPSRIMSHPDQQATLSVWNWVADIQGATMGVGLENFYLSFQAMHSGDIEFRNETPSVDPLSTFRYTLFNTGLAYAKQFGSFDLGIGSELIYERTLNNASTGLSLNFSGAYAISERVLLSLGLSHVGIMGKLDEESTELPTEAWLELDLDVAGINLISELNSGDIPVTFAAAYPVLGRFEILGSLQLEPNESLSIHPSLGFTTTWDNFIFGYSMYQVAHNLGPRHFVTLYWNYK